MTEQERGKGKGKGSKELADLHEKWAVLLHRIDIWRQVQLVHIPHTANLIAASTAVDENGLPRLEMVKNAPLFLPSSLPAHIRSLSEMTHICETEKRLHFAQAKDALVEI